MPCPLAFKPLCTPRLPGLGRRRASAGHSVLPVQPPGEGILQHVGTRCLRSFNSSIPDILVDSLPFPLRDVRQEVQHGFLEIQQLLRRSGLHGLEVLQLGHQRDAIASTLIDQFLPSPFHGAGFMDGRLPTLHPATACLSRFRTRFDLCSCFGLHGLAQNKTGQGLT